MNRVAALLLLMTVVAMADQRPEIRVIIQREPVFPGDCMEGDVIVQYTVTDTGRTENVKIVAADPPGLFEESAIRAVLAWKYEPRYENGKAIAVHGVKTKLTFYIDESRYPACRK